MGNPQERSLAWLAGILEAEGSISFQAYIKKNGCVMIQPYLCIVNTDEKIIDECMKLMRQILEGEKNAKPRICGHSGTNRKCVNLRVDGRSCRIILKVLLPYIVGEKRHNAEVVIKYIDNRDGLMFSRDKLGRLRRKGYTRKEIELVCSIRTHKLAKSSETICRAANVVG